MILEAPPSRYRVEERGGRLVVIDRQMGTETVTRAEPVAVKPHVLTGERGSALRLRATPKALPRAASARPPGAPPTADFLVNLAMFFTHAAPAGRVLRTQRWFDASAPRQAVLDPSQTRRLGALVVLGVFWRGAARWSATISSGTGAAWTRPSDSSFRTGYGPTAPLLSARYVTVD